MTKTNHFIKVKLTYNILLVLLYDIMICYFYALGHDYQDKYSYTIQMISKLLPIFLRPSIYYTPDTYSYYNWKYVPSSPYFAHSSNPLPATTDKLFSVSINLFLFLLCLFIFFLRFHM